MRVNYLRPESLLHHMSRSDQPRTGARAPSSAHTDPSAGGGDARAGSAAMTFAYAPLPAGLLPALFSADHTAATSTGAAVDMMVSMVNE